MHREARRIQEDQVIMQFKDLQEPLCPTSK